MIADKAIVARNATVFLATRAMLYLAEIVV
jgi:hypothetical protein